MNLTDTRLKFIIDKGYGLTNIHILNIYWWFGNQFICIFEKNKPSIISVHPNRIYCDVCNRRCARGRKGNNFNKCYMIETVNPVETANPVEKDNQQ